MRPVEFPEQNVVMAKDQPQYQPLPAARELGGDGRLTSCWRLEWRERLVVLLPGRIYVTCVTYGQPLQPLKAGVTFEEAL